MSLLARHRYIINRLSEAFSITDEAEMELMVLSPSVIQSIDYFFTADGPTRIFVMLEKNSSGEGSSIHESSRLVVLYDEFKHLSKTVIYFMKNRRGKDNDDHYAIDPSKVNDGALSFGIIRSPLESMEVLMRCVYRPLIQDMGDTYWGEATPEQRNEFLLSLDAFSHGLQENIRSLSGGLELRKPDERVELLGNAVVNDHVIVTHSMNTLQDWCNNIARYLDDSDRSRWETIDSGPDTELEYWRSRMQR